LMAHKEGLEWKGRTEAAFSPSRHYVIPAIYLCKRSNLLEGRDAQIHRQYYTGNLLEGRDAQLHRLTKLQ